MILPQSPHFRKHVAAHRLFWCRAHSGLKPETTHWVWRMRLSATSDHRSVGSGSEVVRTLVHAPGCGQGASRDGIVLDRGHDQPDSEDLGGVAVKSSPTEFRRRCPGRRGRSAAPLENRMSGATPSLLSVVLVQTRRCKKSAPISFSWMVRILRLWRVKPRRKSPRSLGGASLSDTIRS